MAMFHVCLVGGSGGGNPGVSEPARIEKQRRDRTGASRQGWRRGQTTRGRGRTSAERGQARKIARKMSRGSRRGNERRWTTIEIIRAHHGRAEQLHAWRFGWATQRRRDAQSGGGVSRPPRLSSGPGPSHAEVALRSSDACAHRRTLRRTDGKRSAHRGRRARPKTRPLRGTCGRGPIAAGGGEPVR